MDSYDCQITDSLTLDKILASKAESHISIDVKSAIVLGTLCCTSVVMTCPPVWLGGRNGRRASVLQARLSSLATSSTLLDGASLFDLTILHIATTTHVSHKLNYPSIWTTKHRVCPRISDCHIHNSRSSLVCVKTAVLELRDLAGLLWFVCLASYIPSELAVLVYWPRRHHLPFDQTPHIRHLSFEARKIVGPRPLHHIQPWTPRQFPYHLSRIWPQRTSPRTST